MDFESWWEKKSALIDGGLRWMLEPIAKCAWDASRMHKDHCPNCGEHQWPILHCEQCGHNWSMD
jgi:hypothetical protein